MLKCKALVETEDAVYRTQLLWAKLNGAGKLSESRDLLTASVASSFSAWSSWYR